MMKAGDLFSRAFAMGYWQEDLKDNPVLYRAYANLLDASENNVPAFEREVQRQGLWEEYQHWRKAKDAEKAKAQEAQDGRLAFTGKKIISGMVSLFKGKDYE